MDIFTRFSTAVVPGFRFKAADVVAVLEKVCKEAGYPKTSRID
jgi:putative transposase